MERTNNIFGTLANILVSVLYVALGAMMIFVKGDWLTIFCYSMEVLVVILGIYLMLRFFLQEEYHSITNYGFSAGILLVIVGTCAIIKTKSIVSYAPVLLGVFMLVMGVIMLQNTISIKYLGGKSWWLSLIFTIATILFAIVLIIGLFDIATKHTQIFYIGLIVAGVFNIISFISNATSASKYRKVHKIDGEKARRERDALLNDKDDFFAEETVEEVVEEPKQAEESQFEEE